MIYCSKFKPARRAHYNNNSPFQAYFNGKPPLRMHVMNETLPKKQLN
jgi:hypothetical protein